MTRAQSERLQPVIVIYDKIFWSLSEMEVYTWGEYIHIVTVSDAAWINGCKAPFFIMKQVNPTMITAKYVKWSQEQVTLPWPRVHRVRQPSLLKSGKSNKQDHYAWVAVIAEWHHHKFLMLSDTTIEKYKHKQCVIDYYWIVMLGYLLFAVKFKNWQDGSWVSYDTKNIVFIYACLFMRAFRHGQEKYLK